MSGFGALGYVLTAQGQHRSPCLLQTPEGQWCVCPAPSVAVVTQGAAHRLARGAPEGGTRACGPRSPLPPHPVLALGTESSRGWRMT